MIKKILAILLLILAIASSAFPADKVKTDFRLTAPSKTWEIGILGVVNFEGYDGDVLDDNSPGLGLRAGYRINENWSGIIEILSIMNTDVDLPALSNVDIFDYIVGVNYDINLGETYFSPFISLGFGYRTIKDLDGRDDWNVLPGAGIKLMLNDSVQLLIEGKARFNLDENEKGISCTVGMSYLF